MKKFKYTALNEKKIELEGFIEAKSNEEAEKRLKDLGFIKYEIQEIQNKNPNEIKDLIEFKFEGTQNNQHIDGKIHAKSFNHALIELTNKYQIQPLKLAQIQTSDEEFNESIHKINSFLKRIDFYVQKPNSNISQNNDEFFIFIKSIVEDFSHYFKDNSLEKINNLIQKYSQTKSTKNKKQLQKLLDLILAELLDINNYKKSSSKNGLEYIIKETLNIFHSLSTKNGFNFINTKLKNILTTSSDIIRSLLFKEIFKTEKQINLNINNIKDDLKTIGTTGLVIFFFSIYIHNLEFLKFEIPQIWYKFGVLFFSVYSSFNFNKFMESNPFKSKFIILTNLINFYILILI